MNFSPADYLRLVTVAQSRRAPPGFSDADPEQWPWPCIADIIILDCVAPSTMAAKLLWRQALNL